MTHRLNIGAVLVRLAGQRPIFHSEADLQLALAWTLQQTYPEATVRLEKRMLDEPRLVVDVLANVAGERIAIELKYLKAKADVVVDGERFVLNLGTPDLGRYDTVKDLTRIERLVDGGHVDRGAVVLLTNHATLWNPPVRRAPSGDAQFRLHDGATLSGTLEWGDAAGAGTRKDRELAHALRGTYSLAWRPYSRVGDGPGQELRVLQIDVAAD